MAKSGMLRMVTDFRKGIISMVFPFFPTAAKHRKIFLLLWEYLNDDDRKILRKINFVKQSAIAIMLMTLNIYCLHLPL